ncbi:uncharacterized protein TRIADDRAFT_60580 [Trichoplax adhaerens]|uniref:G-protein coupled receptors family 1 profile domain-containing protein n=1 Tax=Trichoplax adhaerens TaxID=10228 RepID=B3S8L4_TRIAD|nr:hypothetical protein TRIADDRAFT_60580 [Trichoplax adhaerens]EDV20905.1 hypothetical protein TRIADDRAFT_60580 [Trichoplax adhaerens]|eukprot:XP_002116549.1 hypothetical protein TRIADDRAFT_60580 [Trichoplax adhaerens]
MAAIITAPVLVTNIGVVMLIVCKDRLKTPSNAILLSSCVVCLVLAIELIASAIASILISDITKFTGLLCILNKSTELTLCAVFNFHVTAISLERYYSVIFPFKYQKLSDRKNTAIATILLWTIPFIIIYLPVTISAIQINQGCSNWTDIYSVKVAFYYVLFPFTLFLPPIVTLFAYTSIIYKIYAITRKTWPATTENSNPEPRNVAFQLIINHKKALIQMLMMLGTYALSFFPFFAFYIIYVESRGQQFITATYVSYLIAVAYLFSHPILLVLFTASIKEEVKKVLKSNFTCLSRIFGGHTKSNPDTDDKVTRSSHLDPVRTTVISKIAIAT